MSFDFFSRNEQLQALLDRPLIEIVTRDGACYRGRIVTLASRRPFEPPMVRLENANGDRFMIRYSEIVEIRERRQG